jgi:hypothetical protein
MSFTAFNAPTQQRFKREEGVVDGATTALVKEAFREREDLVGRLKVLARTGMYNSAC